MRDSFSSDRFRGAVFAGWFAEAKAVAGRLSARRDAREDLAHEALLRVLEHPPERENAGAWIQRICRNLHVDAWREVERAQRIGTEGPACTPARDAEEAVLASERRRVVRRALLALPRGQRRALILRFYAGWSFDRIAARLGMRVATMRTRVHRALAALRAHVAAVRLWVMPGALSLKPALAVLIVFAAGGTPSVARRPALVIPSVESRAAAGGRTSERAARASGPRRLTVADAARAGREGPGSSPRLTPAPRRRRARPPPRRRR